MLKILSIDVYALLNQGDTLSFVNPLAAKKFYIFPDILHELFIMSIPVGESVVVKRVYRYGPIMLLDRVSCVGLVELVILYFDVILVWINCMIALPLYIVEQGW